jgi:hypothetical protein
MVKMKKIFFLFVGITLLFSGCANHSGLTRNANVHSTEVVLSKKNFRVIASVQGESQASYVFGIGGLKRNAMIAEAKAKMLANANIMGGAKAIINETVEIKRSYFPFFSTYTVTVSAHIIEFTE